MPSKERFVGELARVCAPGGRVIIVTWCHRVLAPGEAGLRPEEQSLLDRICEAYYLPAWCSVADYQRLFEANGLTVGGGAGRRVVLVAQTRRLLGWCSVFLGVEEGAALGAGLTTTWAHGAQPAAQRPCCCTALCMLTLWSSVQYSGCTAA
jgi:hypothetical protein